MISERILYRFTACLILFLTLSLCGLAQTLTPKHEVRAVWLTTIQNLDWPTTFARSEASQRKQQQELTTILDSLKAAGINTVLLQTRVRATTIYPSAIEPWDKALTGSYGKAPGYDPLSFAIEECHKRGMELHAWVVSIPIGEWKSEGCKRLYKKHPKMVRRIKNEGFMNPEHPETAGYIARLCREITTQYDIDGIHLDYIRYPETWRVNISKTKARQHITRIVEEVSRAVKSEKPWVKMSCAPIGKYTNLDRQRSYGWDAFNKGCQDAQLWLKEGYMDMLFPMMYFDGKHFYPFLMDWKENDHGRTVVAGLGTYQLSPKEANWSLSRIERQMWVARAVGMGTAHFRSRFLTDNLKGVYDLTSEELNRHPALVPPMTWMASEKPEKPKGLKLRRLVAGDELTWEPTDCLYNVYASTSYPVDINNPALLIATRLRKPVATIPEPKGELYYAVTSVDRYGNESEAAETKPERDLTNIQSTINNDGQTLFIPTDNTMFDAEFLIVETLQGGVIAAKQYINGQIDISDIAEGMYVVRSLGRKGVSHRLGFFTIKRHSIIKN